MEDTVRREGHAELGVEAHPVRRLSSHYTPEYDIELAGFICQLGNPDLSPSAREVEDVLWLTPSESADHPDGLPSNRLFARDLPDLRPPASPPSDADFDTFPPSASVGDRLRHFRRLRGISAVELAEAMGVPASELSGYEEGRFLPDVFVLARAAVRLDLPIRTLLPASPSEYAKAEEALFDIWGSPGRAGVFVEALDLLWLDDLLRCRLVVSGIWDGSTPMRRMRWRTGWGFYLRLSPTF